MRLTNLLFLTFMVSGALGCAPVTTAITQEKQQDTGKEAAIADLQLYNEAKAALLAGNYPQAANNFGTLAIRHPLNNHAQQALLETAADNVTRGQAATAITSAEKFIGQNPNHPHVDYAYYHRGLVAFYDSLPTLEAADPAAATPQASAPVRRAFQYLAELLRNTPSSVFAADTTQRMLHIRNTLARHEVAIAKHYLTQGDLARAAARAKYVVQNYQPSPAAADALALLTQVNALPAKKSEAAVAAATVAAEPSQATAPSSAPSATTRWVLSQNPEHYTLQIFSTSNEKFIKNHIAKHQLTGKADYFRSGADTYALVYGAYPTKSAAQQAARQLPRYLIVGKPWIRTFKSIHTSLKQ